MTTLNDLVRARLLPEAREQTLAALRAQLRAWPAIHWLAWCVTRQERMYVYALFAWTVHRNPVNGLWSGALIPYLLDWAEVHGGPCFPWAQPMVLHVPSGTLHQQHDWIDLLTHHHVTYTVPLED